MNPHEKYQAQKMLDQGHDPEDLVLVITLNRLLRVPDFWRLYDSSRLSEIHQNLKEVREEVLELADTYIPGSHPDNALPVDVRLRKSDGGTPASRSPYDASVRDVPPANVPRNPPDGSGV